MSQNDLPGIGADSDEQIEAEDCLDCLDLHSELDRLHGWIYSDLEDAITKAVWSTLRDAGAVDGHENACTTDEMRTISAIAEAIYAQVIADYEARGEG